MGFSIEPAINNGVLTLSGSNALMSAILGNSNTEVNTKTVFGQMDALNKSSVVQSCVILRADAMSNLTMWAKDYRGKKVYNETVKKDLALVAKFNDSQNFRSFINMAEVYACTYGICYVWKSKMLGLNKFEYHIIPNFLVQPVMTINTDKNFERIVDYYNITAWNGNVLRLETDEVFILKDNDFYNHIDAAFGMSRLYGLGEAISTTLSISEMTTQLIADGGARGIISQGARDVDMLSAPFLDSETKSIQEKLKRYGGLRDQFKYIVAKGAASYTPLTSKIIDMQLPENAQAAILQIGKRFGIPNVYQAIEPRFKAMPEGRKEFYTGTIIPEGTVRFEAIQKMVGMPERDWEYKPDWSHLDFFQESLKESAVALNQALNGLIPAVEKEIITKEQAQSFLEPYLE